MTMIEKVARAIAISEGYFAEEWANYEDAARAAIEAMRQPTDEIFEAGMRVSYDADGIKFIWPAMINAALGEK